MTVTLGRDDLVLCAATVLAASIPERADAAVAAGYAGLGLRPADLARARAEGWTPARIRRLLDDHGLVAAEFDTLTTWLPEHPVRPHDLTGEALWEVVAALGFRAVNVAEMRVEGAATERYAEAFAALCDRAVDLGVLVHLEPLPWSGVPGLRRAADIVRAADRPNGGVMVDTWHHFRGRESDDVLTEVGDLVRGLQINDAPSRPAADLVHETQHDRLLPGHGDAGVAATLDALWRAGVDVPVGVEVMSDALATMPAVAAARQAATAARAVLAASVRTHSPRG